MLIELIFIFIIGLVMGSFMNSLVYRLSKKMPLWKRSLCPHCQQQLLKRDLIPLFSFIFLRGKCRFCKKFIGWEYFAVEIATGLLFALIYLNYHAINLMMLSDLLYVFVLLFILIFDLKYLTILDAILWPALIISFIVNIYLGYQWQGLVFASLVGGGFFYIQHLASRGKWIGFGDVKLGFVLGIMLGLEYLIITLLMAYILGGLFALGLIITKKKKFGDLLPMGSFLAGAGIAVLLYGNLLLKWLLGV
ncbi:MAG: prepilin peptidase [Candidatus Parcubacteria bacterium]|nr:prepilin peptidase [Candidatus Parcubacteria bacterium]